MAILKSEVVAEEFRCGVFELKKARHSGSRARHRRFCPAFNLHDLTERSIRRGPDQSGEDFYQHRGCSLFEKKQSDADDHRGHVHGRAHDLQKACAACKRFENGGEGKSKRVFAEGVDINPKKVEEIPDHGCWENLSGAVENLEDRAGRCAEPV